MKKHDIVFVVLWFMYTAFLVSCFWISYPKVIRIIGYSLGFIYATVKLFFRAKDIKDASQTPSSSEDILLHDEVSGDTEAN